MPQFHSDNDNDELEDEDGAKSKNDIRVDHKRCRITVAGQLPIDEKVTSLDVVVHFRGTTQSQRGSRALFRSKLLEWKGPRQNLKKHAQIIEQKVWQGNADDNWTFTKRLSIPVHSNCSGRGNRGFKFGLVNVLRASMNRNANPESTYSMIFMDSADLGPQMKIIVKTKKCRGRGRPRARMTLCSELRELITNHLEKHPNVSINALAARSKVGASTLRRIVTGTIKGDPSPHTVLNIVSTIKKERCLSKLLQECDGEIGSLLTDCFSQYISTQSRHQLDLDLDDLLQDSISYFIYKLAANSSGVSLSKIVEIYGSIGHEKMKKLIELGFAENCDDVIHAKQKDYCARVETALLHLPHLIQFFKLHEVEKGLNMFYTQSESLSREGISKVKQIQKEAITKIHQIMSEPHFRGDIPYFTIAMSDTLDLGRTEEVLQ